MPALMAVPACGRGPGLDSERVLVLREAALAGPAAVLEHPAPAAARAGLFAQLLDAGRIDQALAVAGHQDARKRALPGAATLATVLALAAFSGEGYANVLAKVAPHLRGGTLLPGQVPSASALSQARARLGEDPLREVFLAHAARTPDFPTAATIFGLVVTAFDGTCLELARDKHLEEVFGAPTGARHPMARMVTLVVCATRRVIAAAIGGYLDSEQHLVDQLAEHLREGTVNLADRNFFSMERWLRFCATGAHLAWRVKNGPKSLPASIIRRLPDGSYLVRLRESDGMRTRRRKEIGDRHARRLPETTARLIEFEITATDTRGTTRTSRMRLLTTLLDHKAYPAQALAALYAERWQVEITYLRIKKELRGTGTVLRARRPDLVRQEIWAYLIVYNTLCDLATDAAALEGIDPDEISFVTVLRLTRDRIAADRPCTHCGHHPENPRDTLTNAIAAHPRERTGRRRTSPRTPRERTTGHTRNVTYTIEITEANLPKTDPPALT
jgi:hypothetical protein